MKIDRWDCLLSGLDTAIGVILSLLVLSLGLGVYGLQLQEPSSVPQLLLALFLSTWTGIIGLVGFAIIPVWMVARTKKCR